MTLGSVTPYCYFLAPGALVTGEPANLPKLFSLVDVEMSARCWSSCCPISVSSRCQPPATSQHTSLADSKICSSSNEIHLGIIFSVSATFHWAMWISINYRGTWSMMKYVVHPIIVEHCEHLTPSFGSQTAVLLPWDLQSHGFDFHDHLLISELARLKRRCTML